MPRLLHIPSQVEGNIWEFSFCETKGHHQIQNPIALILGFFSCFDLRFMCGNKCPNYLSQRMRSCPKTDASVCSSDYVLSTSVQCKKYQLCNSLSSEVVGLFGTGVVNVLNGHLLVQFLITCTIFCPLQDFIQSHFHYQYHWHSNSTWIDSY